MRGPRALAEGRCGQGIASILLAMLLFAMPAWCQTEFVTQYQLDHDVVEIPFEYREHQILIKGEADGHKDLTLLFDSGASAPVLDPILGVHGRHLGDEKFQEAEGVTQAEAIYVKAIQLGAEGSAVKANEISVLLADLSQLSGLLGKRIDGILGITFMTGFVTEIDYDRHLLRFHRSQDYTIQDRKPDNQRSFLFDLSPSNPLPYVKASGMALKGKLSPDFDYPFLLDTGYGGYVSVSHSAAEQTGMLRENTPAVEGVAYGVTHKFRTQKIRVPFLMLGDIDLANKVVSIDYRNSDVIGQPGIVGNRLLQNYHVTLDYPHHKLLLERTAAMEEPDEAERPELGLVVRADGNAFRVDQVKQHSPARQAGVHVGDVLLAVDGKPIHAMRLEQVNEILTAAKTQIKLKLKRGADPNLGTEGEIYTQTLLPLPPLDWKDE